MPAFDLQKRPTHKHRLFSIGCPLVHFSLLKRKPQPIHPARLGTDLFESPQENDGNRESHNIGKPHPKCWREDAILSVMHAGNKKNVIDTDQQNGRHESTGATATPWMYSHGHTEEREKQASDGKRKALLKFYTRVALVAATHGKQTGEASF